MYTKMLCLQQMMDQQHYECYDTQIIIIQEGEILVLQIQVVLIIIITLIVILIVVVLGIIYIVIQLELLIAMHDMIQTLH